MEDTNIANPDIPAPKGGLPSTATGRSVDTSSDEDSDDDDDDTSVPDAADLR